MPDLCITPYTASDSQAACDLEQACVQGGALALRFRRPSFHARSSVYEEALILCGWQGTRLVGTVAAARKPVRLHGRDIVATYFYDLRVHPAYRGQGFSLRLTEAVLERMGHRAECLYLLVAGQNRQMLRLLREHYRVGTEEALPLTYLCLPVFRPRPAADFITTSPEVVHAQYLKATRPTFVPVYRPARYAGHVESVCVEGAGCSLWTNEDLLAEEVVRLPRSLRLLRTLCRPLSPPLPLPHIPRAGETIRSLFLYDLYADTEAALGRLLDTVNAFALRRDYRVLYLLLQAHAPLLKSLRALRRIRFQFPYLLLARGDTVPQPDSNIYIDVRDL